MGAIRLKTTLQKRGPAAAVVLDDEQAREIGEGAKRFPVAATINGYTWRTTAFVRTLSVGSYRTWERG